MSWTRQVGHILVKDLKQHHRVLLLLCAALTLASLLTIGIGTTLDHPPEGQGIIASLLVQLLVFIAAALLVQGDPPTRVDAFWMSRPFHSSAMLASKLLFALLFIVGLPLLFAFACLLYFSLPAVDIAAGIGLGMLNGMAIMAFALTLAAITRDVGRFAIAGMAILATLLAIAALMTRWRNTLDPILPSSIFLAIACAMLLLFQLYRTRTIELASRLLAIATLVFVSASFRFDRSQPPVLSPEAAPGVPRATLIANGRLGLSWSNSEPRLTLMLQASGIPPSHQLFLTRSTIRLHLMDGRSIDLHGSASPYMARDGRAVPRVPGIEWIFPDRVQSRFGLTAVPTGAQWDALATGIRRIEVMGDVQVVEVTIDSLADLRPGRWIERPARRDLIRSRTVARGGIELEMISVDITTGDHARLASWFDFHGDPRAAIVNLARREAMLLYPRESSGASSSFANGAATIARRKVVYATRGESPLATLNVRDEAWFQDAKLALLTWRAIGSYSFRTSAAAEDTMPRAFPDRPDR